MAGKNTAVFGVYRTRTEAETAVDRLLAAGFRNEDISVLLPDNKGSKDFAYEKATKVPEGTTTGAVTGGAIGSTLGLLAGIGALAIPGVGPFIAAGPIMGALAGLGVGGTVGGLIGALVGMGIPEYEAKRYEGRIKEGGILLSVHCDNSEWVKKAKDMLKETGAEDVASAGEASADYAETDKPLPRTSTAGAADYTQREAQRMAAGSSYTVTDYDDDFRRDFNSRFVGRGYTYEQYEPAYRFGSTYASDPRYTDRDWSTVESDARRDWEVRGQGKWEDAKDAIRYAWERVRGRR